MSFLKCAYTGRGTFDLYGFRSTMKIRDDNSTMYNIYIYTTSIYMSSMAYILYIYSGDIHFVCEYILFDQDAWCPDSQVS